MKKKKSRQLARTDPDPYSIAFGLFAALTGGASLAIHISNKFKDISRGKAEARKELFLIEKALTSLNEKYRQLVSTYQEHDVLTHKIELGRHPLMLDHVQREQLRNLHSDIFNAGQQLQDSLADLSSVAGFSNSEAALKLARRLNRLFEKARRSRNLLNFMIDLGSMLVALITFVNYVGKYCNYEVDGTRLPMLRSILRSLQRLKRNSGQDN